MTITRSVLLLFVSVVFFVLAAIAAAVGHDVALPALAWAFAGAAAYVAHLIP